MDVYFVTTGLKEEIEVIKRVRPPRLLCSFWYFKNKPLAWLCEEIGYRPEILLDSGAYSAYTKGKNVNLLDFMDYIEANRAYISRYVSLDVIGDHKTTRMIWLLMRAKGLTPLPVVHYGDGLRAVEYYTDLFAKEIALGATVQIRDKREVARWCAEVKEHFPNVELHLLGSCSQKILQSGAVETCDSSTWYIQAINGRPAAIPGRTREAKITRAEANMRRIMEEFDEIPVPFTDRAVEPADS